MIRLLAWLFHNPDPNLDRRLDWQPRPVRVDPCPPEVVARMEKAVAAEVQRRSR